MHRPLVKSRVAKWMWHCLTAGLGAGKTPRLGRLRSLCVSWLECGSRKLSFRHVTMASYVRPASFCCYFKRALVASRMSISAKNVSIYFVGMKCCMISISNVLFVYIHPQKGKNPLTVPMLFITTFNFSMQKHEKMCIFKTKRAEPLFHLLATGQFHHSFSVFGWKTCSINEPDKQSLCICRSS